MLKKEIRKEVNKKKYSKKNHANPRFRVGESV